jgi:hypothetical protein
MLTSTRVKNLYFTRSCTDHTKFWSGHQRFNSFLVIRVITIYINQTTHNLSLFRVIIRIINLSNDHPSWWHSARVKVTEFYVCTYTRLHKKFYDLINVTTAQTIARQWRCGKPAKFKQYSTTGYFGYQWIIFFHPKMRCVLNQRSVKPYDYCQIQNTKTTSRYSVSLSCP